MTMARGRASICEKLLKKGIGSKKHCDEDLAETIRLTAREDFNCATKRLDELINFYGADVTRDEIREAMMETLGGEKFRPSQWEGGDPSLVVEDDAREKLSLSPAVGVFIPGPKLHPKSRIKMYHGTRCKNAEAILKCGIEAELKHPRTFPGELTEIGLFVTPDKGVAKGFGDCVLSFWVKAEELIPPHQEPNERQLDSWLALTGEPQAVLKKSKKPDEIKLASKYNFKTAKWNDV